MAVRREYIAGLYRDLLGREGSEGEISGWENAPDEASVHAMFAGSPEYAARTGGEATWQDVGGVITPTMPPPTDSPYQVQGAGGDPGFPGGGVDEGGGSRTGGDGTRTVGPSPSASQAVIDYYNRYLGRAPLPGDVEKWLAGTYGWGSGDNLAGIEAGIRSSEEAARRRAATPTTSYSGAPYTGFTPTHDYSAFNTGRVQDPTKSAKDSFAYISNQAPPPPFHSKQAMAQWFQTYVRPGFESQGHKVLSVGEDGFTYTNHEGTFHVDFGQNSGVAGGAQQRLQWLATPADAATAARYPAAAGTAATTGTRAPISGSGGGSTVSNIRSIYEALGPNFGGPGDAGITTGPLQQVGQDPLSLLITNALASFIGNEGMTGFGADTANALKAIIGEGGGVDDGAVAARYESARELLDKGRRTMINDLRGDLANRNLLSEPGIPQGAEIGGLQRITERMAPEFSRALRDIFADESDKADVRLMGALQLATGLSTDQAQSLLAGIGEGTARQVALSDIALRTLQTNMAWSQFLAEFGLERDKVMYEIQNGNIEQMLPLLQAFIQMAGLSNAGFV